MDPNPYNYKPKRPKSEHRRHGGRKFEQKETFLDQRNERNVRGNRFRHEFSLQGSRAGRQWTKEVWNLRLCPQTEQFGHEIGKMWTLVPHR